MATKDVAYLFGSVQDFEKMQRTPKWIYPAAGWQCDDSIGSTWGYTTGMNIRSAESVIHELVELCSMGGNLLLNIFPMDDGSIPDGGPSSRSATGSASTARPSTAPAPGFVWAKVHLYRPRPPVTGRAAPPPSRPRPSGASQCPPSAKPTSASPRPRITCTSSATSVRLALHRRSASSHSPPARPRLPASRC